MILNQPSFFRIPERKVFGKHFPDVLLTFERMNKGYVRVKNGKGRAKKRKDDQEYLKSISTACIGCASMFVEGKLTIPNQRMIAIQIAFMAAPEYIESES